MRIKAISDHITRPVRSPYLADRPFIVWFAVALIVLSGFSGAGIWYYRHQRESFRKDVWSDLNAIADLKVSQIAEWRRSRLAEAGIIWDVASRTPSMERLVAGEKEGGRAAAEVLTGFRKYIQAHSLVVLSPDGRVVWSVPQGLTDVGQTDLDLAKRSLQDRKILFSDLHRAADGNIEINLFVPSMKAADRPKPIAVLVVRLDPNEYLYPLLQRWPTPSHSAETLLVRRSGDSVDYLNELRHIKGSALTLSFPPERVTLPATRAALGIETTMEGIDYRGVPVLAVTRNVPDSPWALVAKMDQAESYAAARQMAKVTGFQVLLLLATLALALALLLARKATQIRNRERQARSEYQELAKHSDELQRLTAHLDIREEESRRVSREIHEEFGNALAGARFSLLDIQARVPNDHPELAARIKSVLEEQKSLIAQVRRISQQLRPPILDQLGLVPAIKWLADDFELRTGMYCAVTIQVPEGAKRQRPYASAIYRVCQEALSNVARHAGSDGADILFSESDSEAILEVRDNGAGFNLSEVSQSSIGIINMRERARSCGGTLDIVTAPGQGTNVRVKIPLIKAAEAVASNEAVER